MEESILKQKAVKKNLTEEIATRKRALNFYSLANILPDPDIVLRKQGKDMRIYKELLCDPHVFACTQSRKAGVLSLDWDINRGLDKDENAQAIEDLLKKLDIHKLINEVDTHTLVGEGAVCRCHLVGVAVVRADAHLYETSPPRSRSAFQYLSADMQNSTIILTVKQLP